MSRLDQLLAQCRPDPASAALRQRRDLALAMTACEWAWRDKKGEEALHSLSTGAPVLVSGQQAGLALGPALLLWKALALVTAADRVERVLGRRPVTVLWLEGNDHDWAEAARAGWPLAGSAPSPQGGEGRPVGRVQASAEWWKQRLDEAAPLGLAAVPALSSMLAEACRGSLTEHTARLLHGLLPDTGLLCLDPSLPALRALAAPLLRQLAQRREEIHHALQTDTQALVAQGLPAPVQVDERPLLFGEDGHGRRLRLEVDAALPGDDALSPSALGRILLQDALLAPAASWLGPTELAYHRQVESAARQLMLPPVLRLPRPHLQLARGEELERWLAVGADPWSPPRAGQAWPLAVLENLPGGAELAVSLGQVEGVAASFNHLCAGKEGAFTQLATRHEALTAHLRQALLDQHKSRHKALLREMHALAAWQDGDGPQERRVNGLALLAHMGGPQVVEGLRREVDPLGEGQQRFVCDGSGAVERVQ